MLWMFQRVMFGAITHEENRGIKDLNLREIVTLAPIIIMIVWMGVYPTFFFKKMDLSVQRFLYDVKARYAAATTAAPPESEPVVIEQEHDTMIHPVTEQEQEKE